MTAPPCRQCRPNRILIVRLSAIGDTIQGLPVLNAVRDRFPLARIAWVVEQRAADVLRGHASLDRLITAPRGWLTSPRTVWQIRRHLRAFGPDVAIDLQGLTKSAVAAWLSGAKRRIGFGGERGRELSPWLNNRLVWATSRHVVDAYLELLRPLGIESPRVRFDVPESEADRAAADEIVERAGCGDGFAVVNPGAGWPSKRWPPARFAAVARHLGAAWGLPSLVICADDERPAAQAVCEAAGGHALLAPSVPLRTLASVCRRARLFVSSDTGPLHLAAAVGTRCVGLFGPWPADRHGPYGRQHVAIQKRVCPGSTRRRRNASTEFIEAIDVASVCEACDRILDRPIACAAR